MKNEILHLNILAMSVIVGVILALFIPANALASDGAGPGVSSTNSVTNDTSSSPAPGVTYGGGDSPSYVVSFGDPSQTGIDPATGAPFDPGIPGGGGGGGGGGGVGGSGSLAVSPSFGCSPSPVKLGNSIICTWACDVANGDNTSDGIGFSTGGASSGSSAPITPQDASNTYGVRCSPSSRQTTVVVEAVSPVLNIAATPARVRSGSIAVVSWNTSNVTSCTTSGPGINAATLSGSAQTGVLTAQSVYTLTCQTLVGPQTATATIFITPGFCEVGTVGCPE